VNPVVKNIAELTSFASVMWPLHPCITVIRAVAMVDVFHQCTREVKQYLARVQIWVVVMSV
jgi:hypothetical protein